MAEILKIVLPTLGALAGGYLGVQWRARSVERQELRQLLDECAAVFARADQRRGGAVVLFIQEGANTSDRGVEAINRFREELSIAEQLRDRLRFRSEEGSPVLEHYSRALDALGKVSIALGTAAALPNDSIGQGVKQMKPIEEGEEEFKRERAAFLDAAQIEAGPRTPAAKRLLAAARHPGRLLPGGPNRGNGD